ncbi:hybrid sensor histidine kinase/response regulator [Oryzomonas japonica]|nr:PAS domain S-box protein [Oryzomonas japonica]
MPEKGNEHQILLANAELKRQVALLEKTLLEKDSALATLQDSEKRYRRLFESAKDGILILDADSGKVVDVNPFLIRLLGYSYEEICGKYIWEVGKFKDIAASREAFRVLQDNEYIRYEDLPLKACDGKPISVEFVSNVYLVDGGKVIQCNIRDITARKRVEKALAESEAKTRSILDNIAIGVALINPEMELLELNRQMREWFPAIDLGQRSICYHAFNEPPLDAVCDDCPTQKTLRDGLVHEGTTKKHQTHRGGVRNYRIVSSPILSSSGEVEAVIELVEDITEKLSLESQFRQSQKMEAVGLLAGGVAHDYNNMLSVILGQTELAMNKVDPDQPLHANLEEIFKAAQRSTDITRQLLAFARKQTIMPVVFDLNQNVESMITMLRRLMGEDIDLAWLPEKGLCPVMMDPVQVNQILANLCVNARDAIDDVGKVTIETEYAYFDEAYCAQHAGFLVGDYVLLAVSDDGYGMDKETLGQIFEPFFTSKELGHGTGLGLSTVYGIVKQNNGFINVYSEPGKGTTFRIYLPRYADQAVVSPRGKKAQIPRGHGETVLVVEDEPAILTVEKMMLEELGYRVLVAGAPGEAVALFEEHACEIHLVITDVVMPDMNGRDLAKRLLSLYPGVKILFMSGYTADVIAHRGVLDEGVNFIQKPFSMKDLAVKVQEALLDR